MDKGKVACEMRVGCKKYWIVRIAGKARFRIVDIHQNIVAEVIKLFVFLLILICDNSVVFCYKVWMVILRLSWHMCR